MHERLLSVLALTVTMYTYAIGDVLPIIQKIETLMAKAKIPVRDTNA